MLFSEMQNIYSVLTDWLVVNCSIGSDHMRAAVIVLLLCEQGESLYI
jgi:hypothetical protein